MQFNKLEAVKKSLGCVVPLIFIRRNFESTGAFSSKDPSYNHLFM